MIPQSIAQNVTGTGIYDAIREKWYWTCYMSILFTMIFMNGCLIFINLFEKQIDKNSTSLKCRAALCFKPHHNQFFHIYICNICMYIYIYIFNAHRPSGSLTFVQEIYRCPVNNTELWWFLCYQMYTFWKKEKQPYKQHSNDVILSCM